MYFLFRQNNSGGYIEKTPDLDWRVYVQADDHYEANRRAEELGIYFDGCNSEIDCPCCGDRWYRADEYDAVSTVQCLFDELTMYLEYTHPTESIAVLHLDNGIRHTIWPHNIRGINAELFALIYQLGDE